MPWHLAILGHGSAAAYYLNTLDRSRYPRIAVIGDSDPWAGHRGVNPSDPKDPVNIVNQNLSMIGHFGGTAPKPAPDLVPRTTWAAMNRKIFDQCRVDWIEGTILRVGKEKTAYLNQRDRAVVGSAEFCYGIEVKRRNFKETYYALKVVVATGAGEHKPPDDRIAVLAKKYPDLFMDMDTFARRTELRRPGKRIIVHGPNAAVDTADTSAYNGCTVYWLANNPAILATPHQVGARDVKDGKLPGSKLINLDRAITDPVTVKVEGGAIKVKCSKEKDELTADHYVWGIGQDSKGAVKFIDSALLNALEPLYDINQRFGETHQTVLGFQLPGTTSLQGFEVVGALARQVLLARGEIKHTYLRDLEKVIKSLQDQLNMWNEEISTYGYEFLVEPLANLALIPPKNLTRTIEIVKNLMATISPTWINIAKALCALILNWVIAKQFIDKAEGKVKDEDLNNAVKILTPSTVGSPQLGSVRAVTAAINGFMPVYVHNSGGGDLNWSHDDQTVLRVFIAINYPCVPEEDCERIIRKMIQGRRSQDPKNPSKEVTPGNWGYSDLQVQQFRDELHMINEKWAMTFTMPKTVGTGRTVTE